MSRTDLIADAFTIIRNAAMIKRDTVDIPASNTLKSVLQILKQNDYIENFKVMEDKKQGMIKVYLRYLSGKSAIKDIKRISKPGLRVYVKQEKVPSVLRGRGLAIVSTSKGIMTDKDAKEQHIGGEVIAYVW
jgi:small subunit ribosomal protein S8